MQDLKFDDVCKMTYPKQGQFFLNAYWKECRDQAEEVWMFAQKFIDLDVRRGAGNMLDEFYAHKFLENLGRVQTVLELREALRKIDKNNDKHMSLIEYLIHWSNKTVDDLMAQEQEVSVTLDQAEAALAEVQHQIDVIETKKASLQAAAEGTGVKARMASAELFQLLNEDPLELNRALLTAQAALRRAKKEGGANAGALWWLEREMEEVAKYRPNTGRKMSKVQQWEGR